MNDLGMGIMMSGPFGGMVNYDTPLNCPPVRNLVGPMVDFTVVQDQGETSQALLLDSDLKPVGSLNTGVMRTLADLSYRNPAETEYEICWAVKVPQDMSYMSSMVSSMRAQNTQVLVSANVDSPAVALLILEELKTRGCEFVIRINATLSSDFVVNGDFLRLLPVADSDFSFDFSEHSDTMFMDSENNIIGGLFDNDAGTVVFRLTTVNPMMAQSLLIDILAVYHPSV